MADFASSALAGYKLGSEIGTDIATGSILRDVYKGQDVSTLSPQEQSTDLQKAAAIANSKGLNSLGYSFQKQAQELQANVLENQLSDVKARQASLGLAGQLVQGATDEKGLTDAVNSVTGLATNEKQMLLGIIKNPNIPFEQKQKSLQTMARTEEQNLRAMALVGSAEERQDRMDARDERLLKSRIDAKIRTGADLTPEEQNYFDYGITPWASKRAAARGTVAVTPAGVVGADASSTGRGAAESGDNYSAVNSASGAMGRYQIMPETLKSLRKLDPSLPKTDAEFLKDPAAQDKAMKLLEAEDKKSLKADGFKDNKVNLATYHRFGAPDGKKVLNAFEDNPSTPLKEALGEKRYNEIVAQNPDLKDKTVSQAITQNFGKGSAPAKEAVAKEPVAEDKLMKQYDEKRGGGLTIKEWDTINPTAIQIGKEYKVKPTNLASATAEEKKSANAAYQVTKLAEDNAQFIKEHPNAVGTLAAIFKSASSKTGNLADNVSSDKRYSGEVAELGKRLFALGLKDAASSAGGRMNVYLEKSFASLYDQSQSDKTLLRIIKARQEEAFNVLRDTYGADKENLDKNKYGLAFAPDADSYVKGGKGGKATADKPTVDINQFFFKKPEASQ
jgi:hypothetical protein